MFDRIILCYNIIYNSDHVLKYPFSIENILVYKTFRNVTNEKKTHKHTCHYKTKYQKFVENHIKYMVNSTII